jgi:hypothetical protein
MHQWVVLKTVVIYIKIYIKTASTYFGAVAQSSGGALFLLTKVIIRAYWVNTKVIIRAC